MTNLSTWWDPLVNREHVDIWFLGSRYVARSFIKEDFAMFVVHPAKFLHALYNMVRCLSHDVTICSKVFQWCNIYGDLQHHSLCYRKEIMAAIVVHMFTYTQWLHGLDHYLYEACNTQEHIIYNTNWEVGAIKLTAIST